MIELKFCLGGELAPLQTLNGFYSGNSIPVNEKLSELFLQLHICEKTGRGIPTITSTYRINKVGNKVGDKVGNKVGDKVGELSLVK